MRLEAIKGFTMIKTHVLADIVSGLFLEWTSVENMTDGPWMYKEARKHAIALLHTWFTLCILTIIKSYLQAEISHFQDFFVLC